MPEKRKHRRANLLYYLKIYDLERLNYVGHLADISLGGFKMVSKSHFPPGQDYHFRIHLPEDYCLKKSFAVKVRSCWSKTDINPDYLASGFCYIALSLESIRLIKMLMHQYELDSSVASAL